VIDIDGHSLYVDSSSELERQKTEYFYNGRRAHVSFHTGIDVDFNEIGCSSEPATDAPSLDQGKGPS
jgi:hypothetical protein